MEEEASGELRLDEPRPDRRQALARLGEEAAERALVAGGLTILDRRHRRRYGEIDLVAARGPLLVFVEVKTRSGLGYGAPAESVTRRKRERMARVASGYLAERGWLARPCRFDVVEVFVAGDRVERVHWVADAFRLTRTG